MTAPDFTTVRSQDRHTLQQLYRQLRERERRGQPADRMRARFAADYAASQEAVAARRAALPAPKLSANLPGWRLPTKSKEATTSQLHRNIIK